MLKNSRVLLEIATRNHPPPLRHMFGDIRTPPLNRQNVPPYQETTSNQS